MTMKNEGERPCPVCTATMNVETQNGVRVDVCAEHGVWFDRGELDELLHQVRRRFRKSADRDRHEARRSGKVSGALWGWWSLLAD